MKDIISSRLEALRDVLKRESLDAFIFLSTDPHNGEYIPVHWQARKWISGFDGSAGIAVVTLNEAALWTDSRYFIAAEAQLKDTEFALMKEGLESTPTITQWLARKLAFSASPSVGIDGGSSCFSYVNNLIKELRASGGITLRTNFDPLEVIWKDRPEIPLNPVYIHEIKYSGESCSSKLQRIKEKIKEHHAEGLLMASLDDIAWTTNLRGSDVCHNPVFLAYMLITQKRVTLFIDSKKLSKQVTSYLKTEGVNLEEYSKIRKALSSYKEYNILMDSKEINYTLYKSVGCQIVDEPSPTTYLKAIKNPIEIEGFHNAMCRDGVAMVKFLCWLENKVQTDELTELSVSEKLQSLRSKQALFKDISFPTISAYKENAAIVHYEPTKESSKPIRAKGFLLLDSGAQYLDATTDITRTIALGELTQEEKLVYTLVLKGHIQLSMLKFPRSSSGTQIDAIARRDMWKEGYNYLHGTGHGVGCFLNVHEGPHGIRMQYLRAPLQEGMTITNEPGIYLKDKFGVRIENTMLIVFDKETQFGKFLGFEPLTLCPIDLKPIIKEDLSFEEISWLNAYHKEVYDKLSPYLEVEEKLWLLNATRPI